MLYIVATLDVDLYDIELVNLRFIVKNYLIL